LVSSKLNVRLACHRPTLTLEHLERSGFVTLSYAANAAVVVAAVVLLDS
jgi:hypothetical protein